MTGQLILTALLVQLVYCLTAASPATNATRRVQQFTNESEKSTKAHLNELVNRTDGGPPDLVRFLSGHLSSPNARPGADQAVISREKVRDKARDKENVRDKVRENVRDKYRDELRNNLRDTTRAETREDRKPAQTFRNVNYSEQNRSALNQRSDLYDAQQSFKNRLVASSNLFNSNAVDSNVGSNSFSSNSFSSNAFSSGFGSKTYDSPDSNPVDSANQSTSFDSTHNQTSSLFNSSGPEYLTYVLTPDQLIIDLVFDNERLLNNYSNSELFNENSLLGSLITDQSFGLRINSTDEESNATDPDPNDRYENITDIHDDNATLDNSIGSHHEELNSHLHFSSLLHHANHHELDVDYMLDESAPASASKANNGSAPNSPTTFDEKAYANLSSEFEPVQQEKLFWGLSLVILPISAVFGNLLVILAVFKEKSLRGVTNYFIVSLAFADLLVAGVVMPFGIYYLVIDAAERVITGKLVTLEKILQHLASNLKVTNGKGFNDQVLLIHQMHQDVTATHSAMNELRTAIDADSVVRAAKRKADSKEASTSKKAKFTN